MVKVLWSTQTAINSMEIMRMDALLDSECISMQMSNTTKEILAKIK